MKNVSSFLLLPLDEGIVLRFNTACGFNLMTGGGGISVRFGWSFLGERPGTGTMLIALGLSQGLVGHAGEAEALAVFQWGRG